MTDEHRTPPAAAGATRRGLVLPAVVASLLAFTLASAAVAAAVGRLEPDVGRAAAVTSFLVGALSFALLAYTAILGRRRRPPGAPATGALRVLRAALILVGVGGLAAVGVGVITALTVENGAAALSVIGSVLLITLIVLLVARVIVSRLR